MSLLSKHKQVSRLYRKIAANSRQEIEQAIKIVKRGGVAKRSQTEVNRFNYMNGRLWNDRDLRGQVPQDRGVPEERPGSAADFLPVPG